MKNKDQGSDYRASGFDTDGIGTNTDILNIRNTRNTRNIRNI